MSLRLKLTLAFTALVSLLFIVGITSYAISDGVESRVGELLSSRGLDLRSVDLRRVSLEIEGFWDESGTFVASDVEVLPEMRPPKLRGAIERTDAARRSFTLFGLDIQVRPDAEFVGSELGTAAFGDLRPGQRVEASCRVVDGQWMAHRIRTRNIKPTDKIKGTASGAEVDGRAPETLDFHGLVVSLAPPDDVPQSALRRIVLATQMALALQESRAAAHELVGRPGQRAGGDARARLDRAARDFEHYLDQAQGVAMESALPLAAARWRRPLAEAQPVFQDHVLSLGDRVEHDAGAARAFLYETLDPFLEVRLLPLVYAYLSEAEETLGDQVRSVAARTRTTARLALATTAVAAVLALILGLLVWNSIHRPIRALHAAALRIGDGHLDTSVEIRSRDEFGVLADAFNAMARDLARTTVSVAHLEVVFDSMAAALVIIDPAGRIVNINRAALRLLDYDREDLIGERFEVICPEGRGAPIVQTSDDGIAVIEEKTLLSRAGTGIPVSFSGAELRSSHGLLQGYVCVAQDLTDRKSIEERVRRSLAEKELLLREIHHRVKNNMQIISSLLAMQLTQVRDVEMAEMLRDSQSRIRSMALIHELLYRTSDLAQIDMHGYLELLTSTLVRSASLPGKVEVELQVADVAMDVDRALATGLIVNELVTNSLKHAFEGDGVVRVALFDDRKGDRVLRVSDNGCGASDEACLDTSDSLGLSLVKMLVRQFGGALDFNGAAGTTVRIRFPLETDEVRAS